MARAAIKTYETDLYHRSGDHVNDDCAVMTSSHNLGYRASYNNDENLLLIRGKHRGLNNLPQVV